MKPIVFILLFISATSFGQNYRPIQENAIRYYINGDGYLKGMRIDSVTTDGANTFYHPFRTPRGYYTLQTLDNNGGSWLGKKIVEKQDGTFLFDNLWGDTITIKTQANVSDSWIMYNDTSDVYYLATVTQKDTMSVLGVIDSVKKISVTAYHTNGQIQTSDPLNNAQILLSKDHGFVSVMELHLIPFHPPGWPYFWDFDYFFDEYLIYGGVTPGLTPSKYMFNLTEFYSPNSKDIYNCEVSDVFITDHFNWPAYGMWKDSIINKVVYADHYDYTYERNTVMSGLQGSMTYYTQVLSPTVTFYKIIDTTRMPEEYSSTAFYYYMPWDSTLCYKSKAYKIKQSYLDLNGNVQTFSYDDILTLKEGCGKILEHFMDVSVPQDPTTNKLIYLSKNGVACGNYHSLLSVDDATGYSNKVQVYPNPANDVLTVENSTGGNLQYRLINIYGQKILSFDSNNRTQNIDVSNVPSGNYMLRLESDDNGVVNRKIQVLH